MMNRFLCVLLVLNFFVISACGSSSPLEPAWPPDRPVQQTPPSVDQDTIDLMVFLLLQSHQIDWSAEGWGYEILWGGLETIYADSISTGNFQRASAVIHAMGVSGEIVFLPTILDGLNGDDPYVAMYALRSMESEYAVYALIQRLPNPDPINRDSAAGSLGAWGWYDEYPLAREKALGALTARLALEEVDWVRETVIDSIVALQGGSEF
jgi:hypothetical protein